tara:strand:+ start:86380 stop:86967 length:588 start_codon:yes stop_codon:yes gene_type:complete
MGDSQSITGWFVALQSGDDNAAERLWDRYFRQIAKLARGRMGHDPTYDEEDLAVSVFDAMVQLARENRYPELGGRDELWALMLVIAQRKMGKRAQYNHRQKRGGSDARQAAVEPDQLPDVGPAPDFSATVEDECQRLLKKLDDDNLREIALLKLDGLTNQEISQKLDMSERTIKRRSVLIRKRWEQELTEEVFNE